MMMLSPRMLQPRCAFTVIGCLCGAVLVIVFQIPYEPTTTDRWVGVVTRYQLGNVLWQLASSHGVARRRNARWCVIDGDGWYSQYKAYLEWPHGPPETCPGWNLVMPPLLRYSQLFEFVPYDGCAVYTNEFLQAPFPRILMTGCLQAYRHFLDGPLPFQLTAKSRALGWVAEHNVTAAIHVRRGDKLTAFANIVPPLHYYYLAVAMLQRRHPREQQRFVVCTDDPAWVSGHPFFKDMLLLNSQDPSFDMAVISACKHKIISIGTFGWWGAFLGEPDSTVIYPLPQVEDVWKTRFHNEDYFPQPWISIEYITPSLISAESDGGPVSKRAENNR